MPKQKKVIKYSLQKSKTPIWFYAVLVLIPLAFLILLEIFLLIFDYGENPDEWISLSDKIEVLNPEISKRYFSGINNPPFSTESFLLKQKLENSFRVVVLGASSGAGYPYQNSASFSKYIRKSLQLTYPETQIEVANVSMAAVNSYTMLDLMPGIIEKKPDLILIYLGHNEYYGALGAGSSQTFGSSRFLTKLILRLNEFKTVQLIKNIISEITGNINNNQSNDGTLMAQVASEKLIELNSEVYKNGLEQFEGNLRDIFNLCKESDVPVIIGTLVSNVKDQPPFNPIKNTNLPSADKIYKEAQLQFANSNYVKADSLFSFAKDLDGLRFRAPEKLNEIIIDLAKEYNFKVADVKSELKHYSDKNIIGGELMTDHLHPNVFGYQLIGKSFLGEMIRNNFLPSSSPAINTELVDSLVRSNYNFTKYDSTIADFRIKILKNDWPYKKAEEKLPRNKIINLVTVEDKIAIDVLDNKISRRDARINLAEYYYSTKNFFLYTDEIIELTEEFPLSNSFANEAGKKLISVKEFVLAEKVLLSGYFVEKDKFNTKWLGIINLANKNYTSAIKFLELSNKFASNDPQVLYNLAAAFTEINEFPKALDLVNKCLFIAPNYANAINIKSQLDKIINK